MGKWGFITFIILKKNDIKWFWHGMLSSFRATQYNCEIVLFKNLKRGTSPVVQGLRLHAPNAGSPGSIPGQGTRSHMPQLKIWCSQINKYFFKNPLGRRGGE